MQDCDADLGLRDLSVKVPSHEALLQQFLTGHLCFDAPSSPHRSVEIFRRPLGLVSGDCSSDDGLPRLRVTVGRDDSVSAAVGNGIVTFAGVVSPVCRDAAELLVRMSGSPIFPKTGI